MKHILPFLVAIISFGGALLVGIGYPLYFTRKNCIIERREFKVGSPHHYAFEINSAIVGDDISFKLFLEDTLPCNSMPVTVKLNVSIGGWQTTMSNIYTLDNDGYCRFKLPSAFVSDDILLTVLELEAPVDACHIKGIKVFIGELL